MKKFIYLILVSILIISFSSCSNTSKMYSLEKAYEHNLLTKEDLWNIAYYYNDCVNASNVEYPIKYISEKMDSQLERKIKKAYIKYNLNDILFPSVNEVNVKKYYGKYSGCHVLEMDNNYIDVDLVFYGEYEIDGIVFLNYTGYYFKVYVE